MYKKKGVWLFRIEKLWKVLTNGAERKRNFFKVRCSLRNIWGIWRNWNTAPKTIQVAKVLSTAFCWHLEVTKVELNGLCSLKEISFFSMAMIWEINSLRFIWFAHSLLSWVCFYLFYLILLSYHYTFHKESQQKCCKNSPQTINCTAIPDLHIKLIWWLGDA